MCHSVENNDDRENRNANIRNLTAFWLLGLTNNFGYVIMLSAADDILKDNSQQNSSTGLNDSTNRSGHLIPDCNKIGTGAILLADILPSLIIKLTAPFYVQAIPYFIKIGVVVGFGLASYPIVAMSHAVWQSLLGVVCASIGAGLGELTCLSLSSFLSRNVISTWGSGTGMAGVAGSLIYAGLTSEAVGLSPRNTLIIMSGVPILQALSYYVLLVKPPGFDQSHCCHKSRHTTAAVDSDIANDENTSLIQSTDNIDESSYINSLTLVEKVKLLKPLLKYMIPLGLVYFAEYFINQALFELIQFQHIFLTTAEQYRWYQVIYQFGVLISRSSLNVLKIKKIWILPILQFINVVVLVLIVLLQFVPWIWIVFALILWEGLLGGAAYVNTFYRVSKELPEENCEFSMGATSLADSLGIALAGAVSIPVHNAICTL